MNGVSLERKSSLFRRSLVEMLGVEPRSAILLVVGYYHPHLECEVLIDGSLSYQSLSVFPDRLQMNDTG